MGCQTLCYLRSEGDNEREAISPYPPHAHEIYRGCCSDDPGNPLGANEATVEEEPVPEQAKLF